MKAPAKINLSLHITGQRKDGYHLLESIVTFSTSENAADIIYLSKAENTRLYTEGEFENEIPKGNENIVLRAVKALVEKFPHKYITPNIRLVKNLPPAAGVGGGSSDAAAVLKAISLLYAIEENDIITLAENLGADVPVCLKQCAAIMSGIGDSIAPLPKIPLMWVVLVTPKIPVSTQTIFDAFDRDCDRHQQCSPAHPEISTGNLHNAQDFAQWLKAHSRNDLQPYTISIVPVIQDIIDIIADSKRCLLARMSGSGATCFGLYGCEEEAQNAAQYIHDQCPVAVRIAVSDLC